MLSEAFVFGVLQVTVTLCINTNTLMYCEKLDVFGRINNNSYKGKVMWILAYETSLYSIDATKLSKHQLLNAVEESKFNSWS
jgi:hypothetical protein